MRTSVVCVHVPVGGCGCVCVGEGDKDDMSSVAEAMISQNMDHSGPIDPQLTDPSLGL